MATTLKKHNLQWLQNTNPTVYNALFDPANPIILFWDDNQVTYDETKLTAQQITQLNNFLNSLGYV